MTCRRDIMISSLPYVLCLLGCLQTALCFRVSVKDGDWIIATLEPSDLRENVTGYATRVMGEPRTHLLPFLNQSDPTASPLVFNSSHHGLCYTVSLLLRQGKSWSKPIHTVVLLTKPRPVDNVVISDYQEAPETGVVFEISSPENNVFSRVNISYAEGREQRYMLYKDFYKGKTVFKHWLPGTCYSNISFQLISEASVNRTTLVRRSDLTHEPRQHRTVPNPPLNISHKIIPLSQRAKPGATQENPQSRWARDVPLIEEQVVQVNQEIQEVLSEQVVGLATQVPYSTAPQRNNSSDDYSTTNFNTTEEDITTVPYWPEPTGPSPRNGEEEFVNAVVSEYEDTNDQGSAMGLPPETSVNPPRLPPVLLELRWLPPRAPTTYDGFNIYIYREGNITETATVDENTHEFFTELTESGIYRVQVTTLSSTGDCEARESTTKTGITFYLSPTGEVLDQPQERPRGVSIRLLGSSTAAVTWAQSSESHNGSLVSVLSLTCHRPSLSQRMENTYCNEENTTTDILSNLTPGAQYRVLVYHTNGPLISPPSEPVIIDIEPTGVRELVVYSLSPTAVILSWQRPYHVAFRKYVLQTFFFNPVTLASEWTTYYEIAATASVIASVRVTDLLPAWFYNFRVSMVTWGDPPLSCCDSSTVSFITAPEAPHISSVEYSHGTLYIRWTYGELFIDMSHSRMLHWQVNAQSRKGSRRSYSTDVTRNVMRASLALPPGDIYNLTVTACTEGKHNSSVPYIIKLEPAPPRSLYAVNATHSSVTLLWTEDGVVDFYQVLCKPIISNNRDLKAPEVLTAQYHVVTISGLLPSSSYNCTVISYSYSTPSQPVYIHITTTAREMNPSIAAISALAVLSILLLSLLVLFLLVLRKKHLQMARDCGAESFVNFASFERDGKLPYNWRRSLFAFLTLLPSCLWTDYLLAFYINPWNKTALKKRKLTSPVQLDDFETYLKDMNKDSAYKFSLQFEELKSVGLDLSHDAADLPINRPKNRYTNILPYDFSRVKLISLHNDEGSDYINANYIPGYTSPKEYIATQGPLPETRNDFWNMVLQQKSHIIVMLTQCNERRRVKCDHYWPFTDEPVAYGEISVEMLSESESPEWTIRNFRLGYADVSQDVLHLNYTSWPDHGVPTVNAIESILQFVHIVRQQANRTKEPIVVHCSAGVGRTGTFIALDRLMQHIREHEFIDILGMVSEMRSHRLSMVQTEEQYVFIHQCVLLMWKKKKQQSITSDVIYENVSKS
ncbi:receptor-type tyrosine-protein phosphatase O isoform X1 [Esox lucius]|uniref:Protein-tyrosine-phosphatase n=1 Tax=Esox lucius TaxID=8010 RepID=A0A3P8XYA6_ESOLU|nr:receptor-type tyrosine-protein phosphatase O isoform X1 [Esox lucius]